MPEHIAEMRFLIHNEDGKIESVFRETPERFWDGMRIELVVRIIDADGAILAQAREARARKEAFDSCFLCGSSGFGRRWERRQIADRKRRLEREVRHADACLRNAALRALQHSMLSGSVALEPRLLAPFRIVQAAEFQGVLSMACRAHEMAVLILESDSLLADSCTLVAWAA